MAEATRIRTKAEEALANHFAALASDDAAAEIRNAAFDAFLEKGLPHRRVEDWKYTDLRALVRDVPAPAQPAAFDASRDALARADVFAPLAPARIVFVNGFFVPSLSDTKGIEGDVEFVSLNRFLADGGSFLSRSQLDASESPILALNGAFVRDGAALRIREDAKVARPLEIVSVFAGSEPGLQTMRHQVMVGKGAEVTILQTFSGPDGVAYHTNVVSEVQVEAQAVVRWIVAQEEGDCAIHLNLLVPRLADDVTFDPFTLASGSLVSRNEVRLSFDAEGSSASLRGATVAKGKQLIDNTLVVDHAVPNCASREQFNSAIDGEAHGVFQGKIIVRKHAQKTDGKMMSRALLLSEEAEFANKPELEIFADDVVCGHGATCGQIDEEMLFFLRSRGLDKREAERLLIQAFLSEVVAEIGDEAVAECLDERIRRALGAPASVTVGEAT
ncbi:Fe-S cluster assembly protein SufD [Faunimonas pinastri]|uniref:Fe-S cluster assembly protein SufD n=1 Tax=Faunimonas pinastri TaxID=1855383 RepID=A0A1H9CYF2_9HYPH|nr:Fe-S cluster assembly protein SufD [Faunimonas pinastri]SEQ05613.1 Fe-S cluster assembly protein SufD [Faunimonas pinastri]